MEQSLKKIHKIYVCGPTVYNFTHIGHARTYTIVDIINRIMSNLMNMNTHLVMNITDLDEKIINRAKKENTDWTSIARTYEKSFFDSMAKLNVKLPNVIIRVSEVIPEIVKYIQVIIDKGFAYTTHDGSVYFDTDAYVREGYVASDLAEDDHSELALTIIMQKRNIKDFALWKGRGTDEVGFDVEFTYGGFRVKNRGVPGWHIECSSMIHKTLGNEIDVHFGGIDLKFPHHHNEIVQANAYHHPAYHPTFKKSWCKEFLHVGHLCIAGLKMSKSLKNFTTVDEALKTINPNQLRWMFVTHKWRDQMDFCDDTIEHAKVFDSTITNFFNRIVNYPFDRLDVKFNEKEVELSQYYSTVKTKIMANLFAFEFDLAARLIAELINKTNTYISVDRPNEHLVRKIYDWLMYLVGVLGFNYQTGCTDSTADIMNVLIDARSSLRELTRDKTVPKEVKQKLFEILDKERNISLKEIGITLQDTKESSSWFKN